MTERPVALLVLGMHRSGTSALTRVLNLLGCALPGDLLGEHDSNPTGHWESARAIEINDALLQSFDRRWDDVRALPDDWMRRPGADLARERIKALIESEFGSAPLWVLKDPRLCLLAPLWMEVLDAMDVDVRVIVPLRDPDEVAASLARRDGITAATSHLLWLRHLGAAEAASRSRPRALTRFEDLLADWNGVTDRIAKQLGIAWPQPPAESQDAIEAFLRPELRHAVSPDVESMALPPAMLTALHANLSTAGNEADWKLIADMADQLELAAGLYDPLVGESRAALESMRRAEMLDARVAELESLLLQREALIDELRRAGESRDAHIADLDRQGEEERGRSVAIALELAESEQQVAAMNGRMAGIERALAEAEEACRVMADSRSWRLTRPLRSINAALGNLRKAKP